jgi:hypothetical protein
MSTDQTLPPLPGSTYAFSLTGSIYTAEDMREYARAALAQRADEPTYDAEFIGLQREELASLPDAAVAEAFRDIAGRNYREAHAGLFRAHVIEKARTFAPAAPAPQRADEPVAEVMPGWSIAWVGSEPIATLLARHPEVRIGTKLYTASPTAPAYVPLSADDIQDSAHEAGLDWHRGWTAGDAPNRYEELCRAIEALVVARMRGEGK